MKRADCSAVIWLIRQVYNPDRNNHLPMPSFETINMASQCRSTFALPLISVTMNNLKRYAQRGDMPTIFVQRFEWPMLPAKRQAI